MWAESRDIIKIANFPKPYNFEYSPHCQIDFNEFCCNNPQKGTYRINTAKVIVIGDISVGKSCLINRLCNKIFETTYKQTIGVDVQLKRFKILDFLFDLQIWDTAGQERFRSIASSYYRGANAIVIVFDLRNLKSLKNVEKWLGDALSVHAERIPYIFLVGSKMDLLEHNDLQNIENIAQEKSVQMNAEYWSVSAKTGKHVEHLFKRISAILFDNLIVDNNSLTNGKITIGTPTISLFALQEQNTARNNLSKCQKGCAK